MIICNKGMVGLDGIKSEILAELSVIVDHMNEHFEEEQIMEAVKRGLMSSEELKAELEQRMKESMKSMVMGGRA